MVGTDRPTDRPTDQKKDIDTYRAAIATNNGTNFLLIADNVWFLGNLIEGLRKHDEQDEEEEDVLKVNDVTIEENIAPECLFRDACKSGQDNQDNNLQSLRQILR